jgi:hypothetical protein
MTWCLHFADILEPTRTWSRWQWLQHGVENLRTMVYAGRMEEGAYLQTSMLLKWFAEIDLPIHPNTRRVNQELAAQLNLDAGFLERHIRSSTTGQERVNMDTNVSPFLKDMGADDEVEHFERYLSQERGKDLAAAAPGDIQSYIAVLETGASDTTREDLRGIALFYKFTGNSELTSFASQLREQRIAKTRSSFPLRDFLGIDPIAIQKLAAMGILTADQMLSAGATPESVLPSPRLPASLGATELVKLSDWHACPV